MSASAERVWAASAAPGAKIRLRVDRLAFTVMATVIRPPERIETRFGVPMLFMGDHSYSVRATPEGAEGGRCSQMEADRGHCANRRLTSPPISVRFIQHERRRRAAWPEGAEWSTSEKP